MPTITLHYRETPKLWVTILIFSVGVILGIVAFAALSTLLDDQPLTRRSLTPWSTPVVMIFAFVAYSMAAPKRTVQLGEGWIVVRNSKDELFRLPLHELARARVYFKRTRKLDLTDRMGRVFELKPHVTSRVPDQVVDWLRAALPHLENTIPSRRKQPQYTERNVDFPPTR